ncbi:unnamed protein product [Rotaria sp. Silwood1]|nr:unnamed protein product [Rotaria sp. Silwood1]CAF4901961.1 unnamed protein product [Rotaria sp. Silwood1]
MRFRFCGGEDCADWILAEIFTLSKLSSVKLKLLCQQVMQAILTDNLNFSEAQKLVGDKFESGDLKASIRALQYILTMSAKHSVDGQSLLNELIQLGLPKEHANALVKVYDENFEKLIDKLRSSVMRLTKMNDIQWNLFDIQTTNNLHDMHLPVVTMNLNYNDNIENQSKSISFSMNPEQFAVLLAESSETFRLFSSDTGTYKEARPFFISTKNLINDYFDGNLAPVFQTINSHTFVFVMYYARMYYFCGISRRMREPFEKAAAFYRERIPHGNITLDKFHVKFVAVDCFYHAGQCRKSYKLEYYPHMYLYVKGTRGYQYFGPTITSNLIEFIEKIRMPIIRLTNVDEFFDFIVQHESNVLAHFDFSNNLQRQYYSFFVQAALKHIEYDNEHPIRFAVILNQTVVEELSNLSNTTFPKSFVILNRLNSTPQIFPNLTNNFTIENLFQWIVNEPKQPYVGWIVPKNRYYSRSPSIDKATVFDALTNHDNLLIFHTSSKLDELKLRYVYFYLSICNTTHSSFWLRQIEKLYNQSLINLNKNISKTQHDLLSSCCQHILNQISSTDIYHLCLLNQQLPLFNFSETTTKACLPILNNIQLQKICYRDYCHQWLKTYASIYQQKLHSNHRTILQKRQDKFYDQSIDIQNQFFIDNNNSIEKFKGLLCQINSTWAFRLIDSKYYPNFGRNIGIMNNSRAIIVLQTKVRHIIDHTSVTGKQ